MPDKPADSGLSSRQRQAMSRRLTASAARMTTAALNEMAERYPWFADLDADNRASITLVVRAGIDGFVAWFSSGALDVTQQSIFAAAPRSLTRALTLHQTVDLIRATIETVEAQIAELPRGDRPVLTTAVLRFSREIAFDAAEVYARAAETRGAWDARLEALVMDAVVRGDADSEVVSRASTLGWQDPAGLCVVIGDLPESEADVHELRAAAVREDLDVLVAPQGPRLVVLLGGNFQHEDEALGHVERLVGSFGPGPVVVGPVVADLEQAVVSARAATSGRRAAPAWPDAPRPVAASALLPERALAGDGHARRELGQTVYERLMAHAGDLVGTLDAFFAEGGSIEATSRRLFIHANTVRYRIARVEDATGYLATDPRDGYVLRLALTLGRLLS